MTSPSSATIFDLDGTLADTMPPHYQAWLEMTERYSFTFPEEEFYSLGGVPTRRIARMLVERHGLTIDPDELAREKEAAIHRRLLEPGAVKPIEAVMAVARSKRGVEPIAIASGGSRKMVESTLAALGIRYWFDAVVTADDTVRHKPDPDVFLEAARRLQVSPEICTVYEDTDQGLEAARRAGMRSVDVRTLYRPTRITAAATVR